MNCLQGVVDAVLSEPTPSRWGQLHSNQHPVPRKNVTDDWALATGY